MAERIKTINPAVDVRGIKAFYDRDSSAALLDPVPDYVVDGIDNITAKLHLIATCLARGIPIVTCLGASAKADPTRVRISSLADTHTDPLARAVRRIIQRKQGIAETRLENVIAVFSDEEPVWPDADYRSELCGVECEPPRDRHIVTIFLFLMQYNSA